MLQFTGVYKSFGNRPILNIPELGLEIGLYWLQGENGSGKTTLLRMIAGLLPFTGEIACMGVSMRSSPRAYRALTGWSEAEPLYPSFVTGTELLRFYSQVRQAPASQGDTLVQLFGMQHYVSAPLSTFSSGMAKKLSLVLAFLGRPALILLDEPLTTLDADAVPLLMQLIHDTFRQEGTGFLLSSHHDITSHQLPELRQLRVTEQKLLRV